MTISSSNEEANTLLSPLKLKPFTYQSPVPMEEKQQNQVTPKCRLNRVGRLPGKHA